MGRRWPEPWGWKHVRRHVGRIPHLHDGRGWRHHHLRHQQLHLVHLVNQKGLVVRVHPGHGDRTIGGWNDI